MTLPFDPRALGNPHSPAEQPVWTTVYTSVVRANGVPTVRIAMVQNGAVMSSYWTPDEIDAIVVNMKQVADEARSKLIAPTGGSSLILPGSGG